MKKLWSLMGAVLSLMIVGVSLAPASVASGSPPTGVTYYISPPFVQGSYVTSDVSRLEFTSLPLGNDSCGTTSGQLIIQGAGCKVLDGASTGSQGAGRYGGAVTLASDDSQAVGSTLVGGATNYYYASTQNNDDPVVVTFTAPMKYLGFWWSAGSPTNQVTFFSGANQLLTLTTADLISIFGAAPAAGTYGTTGSVTAVDSSTYVKHHYFGHPRGYSTTTPTAQSTITAAEPFVYIHVYVSGNTTFDKVELKGNGFEFDNFVVSSSEQSPQPEMVLIGQVLPEVTFLPNGGTGSMAKQTASASTPLTTNSFQRNGFQFVGWATQPGGGGTTYADGATFPFTASATLYAQWAEEFTVTFDPNGGTGTMADQDSHQTANLSANLFENPGYQFGGWNTELDGTGTDYAEGDPFPFTADDTLYAQWIPLGAAPYEGAVITNFSSRNVSACEPAPLTITGIRLAGATLSVQGKTAKVLENTDRKIVFELPAGLAPTKGQNLVLKTQYGTLSFQDAFDIGVCSQALSKGRWTQLQPDGKTVKMYAKDPIRDGKIQFFVDGKEIAWINAVDESDAKLSFASGSPYLVRSVTLNPGKNRFEIKLDGVRVWRATYVPKG